MPAMLLGTDSTAQSTPSDVRRGTRTTVQRVLRDYNADAGAETVLNVSAAAGCTEITWKLVKYLNAATVATLSRSLTGGTITRITDGADGRIQFVIDDTDTDSIDLGFYYGQISVTISGELYKMKPAQVCIKASGSLGGT